MTKENLNKLNMPELWKICKKFGIKRGKHDTKQQLINKIAKNISISGETKNYDNDYDNNLSGEKANVNLSGLSGFSNKEKKLYNLIKETKDAIMKYPANDENPFYSVIRRGQGYPHLSQIVHDYGSMESDMRVPYDKDIKRYVKDYFLNYDYDNDLSGEKANVNLSGYEFLDILLKQDNINLSKLYKKKASLERRKQKGEYNVFFITKDKKLAEKVLNKPGKTIKDYKRTSRKIIKEGFLFFPPEYRKNIYYKIPIQDMKESEIKKVVKYLSK
jgi:hypothetical protein